jgi:lipopolysaccharide transport protein LptA
MAASIPSEAPHGRRASGPRRARPAVALGFALLTLAALAQSPAQSPAQQPAPPPAPAKPADGARDQSVSLDAASSDVDYRSNTVNFRDVVITQGNTRVAADAARATGLNFENATWNFRGNVRISVDGGSLRSAEAVVNFAANRIARATITGSPAEFEQLRSETGELARGRAGLIEYDVPAGTVTLSKAAWLTDGRNEISGQQLVYNVRDQRVQAETRPGQSDRVRITIRPRDAGAAP